MYLFNKKYLNKILEIGILENDTEEEKLAKKMVSFLPFVIGILAIIWGSIYIYIDHYISGLIPISYSILSFLGMWRLSKTKNLKTIQFSQLFLVLFLPFLLMWSLGGYNNGSLVMIWAFFSPVAALSLGKIRSLCWFIVFSILTFISIYFNTFFENTFVPLPKEWIHFFYFINLILGFTGIYLMLKYYIKNSNKSNEKQLLKEHLLLIEKTEELEKANARLGISVQTDHLTGLNNRLFLIERLKYLIETGNSFSLCFIDLDKFKQINDTLGHNIGDEVLIQVSKTLKQNLDKKNMGFRLGGDEFVILFEDFENIDIQSIKLSKIVKELKQVIKYGGLELEITCSLGVSIYPDDLSEEEKLLDSNSIASLIIRNADTAMYKVKQFGKNDFSFFNEKMHFDKIEEITIENELRLALKRDEFEIYYQPQINIKNNSIVGMEALVRWKHPEKGIISPLNFIPIAEKTGLIVNIDRNVMEKSLKQLVIWKKKKLFTGKLSLNLSAIQLGQDDFVEFVQKTLKDTGCKSEWLELEITESHIMKDAEKAIKILTELVNIGIKISIDDFGVGYSSLTYLKRLPVSKLKIDKSFVDGIPYDMGDISIINAIIGMAKGLSMQIIAEGVETEEQKLYLLNNGCKLIQGYLCSKPLNAKDFENFLLKGCQKTKLILEEFII